MSLYINPCFLHWEWWSVRLRNGAPKIWIWISTHAFLSTSAKWNIRKDISFWVSVFSFAIALSVWPPSRRYKIIVQQNIISKPTSFHLFPTQFLTFGFLIHSDLLLGLFSLVTSSMCVTHYIAVKELWASGHDIHSAWNMKPQREAVLWSTGPIPGETWCLHME